MAITKDKKKEVLSELEDKFSRAVAVYFADYRGLDVKSMQDFRGKMRDEDVDYLVAKKTLMKIALKNKGHDEVPSELMEGPVGAAFGYADVVIPAKVIHDFGKGNDALELLGGLVDGKFITKAEAVELAKLPSREELLAKLVGSMNAPVSGFHGVLAGLLRGFVSVVKQYGEQKPEEAKAEEAAPADEKKEEAKAEEAAPAKEEKSES